MVLPTPTSTEPRTITVALIGNPNTGKSTLFNALAGMQARVGNYPGVTVEKKIGRVRFGETTMRLVDLPGTYSLAPRSPDEMVSVDVLLGRQPDVGRIDAVLCIVDASNIERNLFLVSQVLDLGLPTVLVLNMCDVARQRETEIDVAALSQRLGIPVLADRGASPHRYRRGAASHCDGGRVRLRRLGRRSFRGCSTKNPPSWPASFAEMNGNAVPAVSRRADDSRRRTDTSNSRSWRKGRQTWASGSRRPANVWRNPDSASPPPKRRSATRRSATLLAGVLKHPATRPATLSDRIDHFLTHRVSGLIVFAVVMFVPVPVDLHGGAPLHGLDRGGAEAGPLGRRSAHAAGSASKPACATA